MTDEGSSRAMAVAIVGSTSPVGKELREIIESEAESWRLHLLDTDEYAGLLQEFGGEIEIVQVISPDRLRDVDVAVFTCAPAFLDDYVSSGAYLPPVTIDATGGERNGPVFIAGHSAPPLPHPESGRRILIAGGAETTILTRVLTTLDLLAGVESSHATIIGSAADRGRPFMDRLQEETIEILNFQLTEGQTDRLAFNVRGPDDGAARHADRIARQVGALTPERCPAPAIQMALAPVFQGTSLSIYIRLAREVASEDVVACLASEAVGFRHVTDATPLDALGSAQPCLARVTEGAEPGAFWLWIAADGLRVTSANALELIRRRAVVGA